MKDPSNRTTPARLLAAGFTLAAVACVIAAAVSLRRHHGASPARIVSGSMAPCLIGPHWRIACGDCGYSYRCSTEQSPAPSDVVCPMCGFRQAPPTDLPALGDRVQVNAASLRQREPRRWEVVAFAKKDDLNHWEAKRVIGLPGESIRIHGGDIYVDGMIAQKSLAELRSMAPLVYDAQFASQNKALATRWDFSPNDGWSRSEDGFVFSPQDATAASPWLEYKHWAGIASPLARTSPSPVLDHYGENQDVSRRLHLTADLMVTCRVSAGPNAVVELQLYSEERSVRARWNAAAGSAALLARDHTLIEKECSCDSPESVKVVFAVLDGRMILNVGDACRLQCDLAPMLDRASSGTPLAFKVTGDHARIDRIELYRDLHYLGPKLTGRDWSLSLGKSEYLLLGDNVPVSIDSRQLGPVQRAQILGVVEW